MKRTIAILLSLIMIFCLSACGNSAGQSENDASENPPAVQTQPVENEADDNTQEETDAAQDAEEKNTAEAQLSAEQDAGETTQPEHDAETEQTNRILVAYFSATNTTEGVAKRMAEGLNADLYEIIPQEPYTDADLDYNDKNSRSTREMNDPDSRPAISGSVENMEQYDIVFIGYPNWWASIPMPIASFLDEYDFSGKTIIPFCSHGGGRFGQSLTAIAKLAPDSEMGEGLSVHYSGGSSLSDDIAEWLKINGIPLLFPL